jgi:hypothetical protein
MRSLPLFTLTPLVVSSKVMERNQLSTASRMLMPLNSGWPSAMVCCGATKRRFSTPICAIWPLTSIFSTSA